jgi:hypothetical protein
MHSRFSQAVLCSRAEHMKETKKFVYFSFSIRAVARYYRLLIHSAFETTLINMNTGLLFSICALLVYENIFTAASKRSHKKAEDLIEDICDKLFDEDLQSDENQRWERLCQNWMKSVHQQRHSVKPDENIIDGK